MIKAAYDAVSGIVVTGNPCWQEMMFLYISCNQKTKPELPTNIVRGSLQ